MKRLLIAVVLVGAACDSGNKKQQANPDMAMMLQMQNPDMTMMQQSNPDMTPGCVMNPTTHLELINACTSADFVDKMPQYPTLAPNGALPPLP